jgi:rubrerythrin
MSDLTLDAVDRDGAIEEAMTGLCGPTRAQLLRRAALGGAAMLAALAAGPAAAEADGLATRDLDILNFGLRFERLQATFYTQAAQTGTVGRMSAESQRWAQTLGAHERAHVRIIKAVLGSKAGPKPFFDFGSATETPAAFTRTAVSMEDLTVAMLTGVLPRMRDRGLVAALFGLLTVEARHAAWARHIVGTTPAAQAFDRPRTLESVRGVVAQTHFIVTKPRMNGAAAPQFTG